MCIKISFNISIYIFELMCVCGEGGGGDHSINQLVNNVGWFYIYSPIFLLERFLSFNPN